MRRIFCFATFLLFITLLLTGRIDRVLKFYKKTDSGFWEGTDIYHSGGQGPNELVQKAFHASLFTEERGAGRVIFCRKTNPATRMKICCFPKKWSNQPIQKKVTFSTTNYHVFRSGLMARRVKMRAAGIGGKNEVVFLAKCNCTWVYRYFDRASFETGVDFGWHGFPVRHFNDFVLYVLMIRQYIIKLCQNKKEVGVHSRLYMLLQANPKMER